MEKTDKPEIQIDISRLSIIDKENTHPDKIINKDGQYFLEILKAEVERFTALCEQAEKDITENSLSDEGEACYFYLCFVLAFNQEHFHNVSIAQFKYGGRFYPVFVCS